MNPEKKRILLVDDDAALTRMVRLNLEETGRYVVQVENHADQAYATAKRFQPDLVLLDVMMPETDGGAVASRFRESSQLQEVPIVFLTAAVKRTEVRSHGGRIGEFPFLAKPVDLEELLQCIEQHLRR